jgi:hypothetical protein
MKKLILTLFLITIQHVFYAQTSEKVALETKNEIDKIRSENKKKEKIIEDPNYKIKISTYGNNLIEYNRVYQNYYYFTNIYFVKKDVIVYSHRKGKSTKPSSGKVNENASYGDLYEIEYFFIDKNKGFKFEKNVSLFKGDNIIEKQKELDKLGFTITEISNLDYNSIYKFYSIYVIKK